MNITFPEFWKSLTAKERKDLADRAGISIAYLRHIALGNRHAGALTIDRLMKADNRITFQMMRPPEAA